MLNLESYSWRVKVANLCTTVPNTFLHPFDRVDPYKLYRGPNSGEGNKITTPMSQGVAEDPPDMAADFMLWEQGPSEHKEEYHHNFDYGDPESPFSGRERLEGETEYGEGTADGTWADPSSPISRGRAIFEAAPNSGSMEKMLHRRRKI